MAEELSVPLTAVVTITPLRQPVGSTLHWDCLSGACHDRGPNTVSDHQQRSSFQAQGPSVSAWRGQRYWKTSEIRPVPALSLQTIAWEREAELATFSLDAVPLSY